MQGVQAEIRNNCLLDLVENNETYNIVEIAQVLLLTDEKVKAILRNGLNKVERSGLLDEHSELNSNS